MRNIKHEEWGVYSIENEDGPVFISYNQIAKEVFKTTPGPYSKCIKLFVAVKETNRLPTNDEMNIMNDVEHYFETLIKNNKGIYVGRLTMKGGRIFYGYLENLSSDKKEIFLEKTCHPYKENFKSIKLKVSDDSKQKEYHDCLLPNEEEEQIVSDNQILSALSENGDDLNASRKICYFLFFPNKSSLSAFKESIHECNFEIENQDMRDKMHLLEISHVESPIDVSRITIYLYRQAEKNGGHLDGWETEVVKKTNEN